MSFLLDTNILSAHLRRPAGLAHRFFQHSGRLFTSTICLGELYVWAFARSNSTPTLNAIEQLLQYEVGVVDFDRQCAMEFGRVRVAMRRQGIEFSTTDLMIASVALVHDLTLVTHNTADFERVPDLSLVDWLTP